jgi:hypothetical protein
LLAAKISLDILGFIMQDRECASSAKEALQGFVGLVKSRLPGGFFLFTIILGALYGALTHHRRFHYMPALISQ